MASLSHNGGLESFELIPDQPTQLNVADASTSLQRDLMSAAFDLNSDEIQRRLLELAEDNIALRESLRHSSEVMRNDLTAIASWHNNITTTIAQQEIALQEANDRIKVLVEEKERLEEKVREESSIKLENTVPSDEEEFEIVQRKSKAAEKAQLKDAEAQIAKLSQEMEEQQLKIKSLQSMYEEIEKERDLLNTRLANQEELNAKVCDLQKQVFDFEQNNSDLRAKLSCLQEQQAPSANSHVNELKDRIVHLEEKLAWEERATEAEMVKHKEAKKLLSVLQSNYDRVTKILQLQTRNLKEKDMSCDGEREAESRRNLEQIDNLTAKLFDLEQQLEERDAKLLALSSERGMQQEEAASIPVLKAQVEVYKIDLDNAVLAKEAAQEEVIQLTQQLRDMQQAAAFCTHCGSGSESTSPTRGGSGRVGRRRGSRQPESIHPRAVDADLFVCPICQFGFTELQALENHVNNCIDKSEH